MRNRSHRQEVRTIAEYITAETGLPPYLPYPRFLLKMELSHTARLLYALLLDRSTLSQKNGWQDDEGRTYIVYPIAEIAEILDKSTMTVQNSLKELDIAGLLERKRAGYSAPNRLYVKVPPVVKVSLDMTQRKLYPNQTNINNLTESQTMGASGEPPAPFGRYKNIFLSDMEYAELKEEYPDRLERFIEELSQYVAAVGRGYANYAAAVRMWAERDKKGTGKKGIPDYSCKEGESF